MSDEEDAEQVVYFSLVPVGAVVEPADAGDRRGFVCVGFDADASVVPDGEEVVDDFEARVAGWIVHGGDVGYAGEFGGGVVFEEVEGGEDAGGGDVDCELVFPHGESGCGVNA